MKLNATKFGLACAISTALLWVICSIFVMLMPVGMMEMSGDMLHMDLSRMNMNWDMGLHGLFTGLIAWVIGAGFSGWLIAAIYNKLLND